MNLSWHQQQAVKRAWKTRNLPAHIYSGYGITALCGYYRPKVTIEPEFRNNPENKCCKHCKAAADKLNLPITK